MGKLAIGAGIRSPRVDGCSAVIGAPQRLACEWSPRAGNHRGSIPTFTIALHLRRLRRCRRTVESRRAIGEGIGAVQDQKVHVDIQIERRSKALNKGHHLGLGTGHSGETAQARFGGLDTAYQSQDLRGRERLPGHLPDLAG